MRNTGFIAGMWCKLYLLLKVLTFFYDLVWIFLKRSTIYELELDSPSNCFNIIENLNKEGYSSNYSTNNVWKKLDSVKIEIPKNTLLLAEKVVEYRGNVRLI